MSHPAQQPVRIGVDTGGTFTDCVLLEDGRMRVHKLRSTPSDPSQAILQGIAKLLADTQPHPTREAEITHGSTVATNALLERKGARVAMLTTAGFEDVLAIGRQTRPELYNFMVQRPEPLVQRTLTFGVRERIAADGRILTALQEREIQQLTLRLRHAKAESIAICLLHSYANPAHERQLAQALRAAGFAISASHEILPEYREFERWSTTAVNAYVLPLMDAYLARLQSDLAPASTLRIMQSNGGSISARTARTAAVQTILSGPAAGVIGAQALAQASGFERVITLDMGGTSTDVSLVDGVIGTTMDSLVGTLPVRLPVLDIHTVGAGGGSIAWIDAGEALRVGPRSAGAEPGPACYGTGDLLTVTDANLLLGRLDPACFLGGRMNLDLTRTRRLAQALAARLGLSVPALAEGIVRIADSSMERAIRVVSVERGHDPRDFALLAFGGAGGLHACALADALEMRTVLIPEHSGVLSALGMLVADVVKDYSASILKPTAELAPGALNATLEPLMRRAEQDLHTEGFAPTHRHFEPTLAMRYRGQAYELAVPFRPGYAEDFHRLHAQRYGYSNAQRPTEVVQLRLRALGRTSKPTLSGASTEPCALPAPAALRKAIFARRALSTPVFHRGSLKPGMAGQGPAIIITGESTNIIAPGWAWRIDAIGTLVATRTLAPRATRPSAGKAGPHAH